MLSKREERIFERNALIFKKRETKTGNCIIVLE